ncbi:MAG: MFS transporter [Chloroflexi bacterium]|nr:MFS transporter [Chloroflexota bacterium]MDA1270077.1 MFS transporter [Chloroflexota bacterium]
MANFSLKPSNMVLAGRPVHYAWVIVAVAACMRLFSSSFRSSSSILIPRLVDSFGWSYGAVGLGFSIQWIVSGLFGPPAGMLGDRYGVRWTMALGAALFIVGMVLTGTMNHLWQFYLYFGVILSAAMGIFQVPLTAAVTLWFRKRLGTGMGLLQSSQGIGPLVAVPVMLIIIELFGGDIGGLRAAFIIPGIVGGTILLLLVRLFYNEPAAIGVRALGAPEDEPIKAVQTRDVAKVRTKVFLKQAQRTSAFWNLIGIHFWGCAGHAIILVYLVAMAEDEGVSKGLAAGAFVTMSVTSTITRFAVPVIADRMGSKPAMAGCFFLQVAPIFLLFFAQEAWQFYLFAVLFGIGFGGEMSAFPIINRQYYGSGPIGTTYGYQMMGAGVGMATGALIGGQLRDWTGNFDATMALSLVLSFIGVISIMVLPTTKKELLPNWEAELTPANAASTAADD